MRHVIKRYDQGGGYLHGDPGTTGKAWTKDLREAKIFPNYETAKAETCPENEIAIPLDIELRYAPPFDV